METSYLLPYLFSAADCGEEMRVVRESDENASESRTGSEGGPLFPGGHHQGNWIRHFSNPTHSYRCSTGRVETVFSPLRG